MKLLITGAGQPLGQLATTHLRAEHDLRLTGQAASTAMSSDLSYHQADLRDPDQVIPLVEGIEAILHLAPFDPLPLDAQDSSAEKERLDQAARGSYVLLDQARQSGVERLILASTLASFDYYPAEYIIDETWHPEPDPRAEPLAPFLSEITCREFAREGGIRTICLRFGPIDQPGGTPAETALQALSAALTLPFTGTGYQWRLYHVSTNPRYPSRAAQEALKINLPGI